MPTRRNPIATRLSTPAKLITAVEAWSKRHGMPIWWMGEMKPGLLQMTNDWPDVFENGRETYPRCAADPRRVRRAIQDLHIVAKKHGYVMQADIFASKFEFKAVAKG